LITRTIIFLCIAVPSFVRSQELIITEKVKLLALGDSYTIGQSVSTDQRWPNQLISQLKSRGLECFDSKIIATSGWRTDDLKKAITNEKPSSDYNLVGLLIGVNNYYQGRSSSVYATEFEELLNKAIELAGNEKKHVFVISIPDYGYTPFGQSKQAQITNGINEFNGINRGIAEKLGVKYIFITDISRRGISEPDLVANDGLHPSGKMYAEWVDRIVAASTVAADTSTVITAIAAETGKNYVLRPNPVKNFVQIESPAVESYGILIRDCLGKIVLKSTMNSNESLDTSSLPVGMYYYLITGKNGHSAGRFIKE
jgi:lysophospholipase L1-like esterase